MANIITGIRIVISVILLFCPVLSPAFYMLYIAAGITDMADGAAARRTGTASEFGSKLDTAADIVFAVVCLIRLLPVLHVPLWIWIWIAVIAFIKAANIAAGFFCRKEFISVHSMMNKAAGGLLFVFPLTTAFIDLRYSAAVVCVAATAAAVQESIIVLERCRERPVILYSYSEHFESQGISEVRCPASDSSHDCTNTDHLEPEK